jgi:hypothetical protein
MDFAARRFLQWHKEGRLSAEQAQAITAFYQKQRQDKIEAAKRGQPLPEKTGLFPWDKCWACSTRFDEPETTCAACGVPLQTAGVRSLRWLVFVCHEIKIHQVSGRLSLAQAHACLAETRERIAALRQRLENERIAPSRPRRVLPPAPRPTLGATASSLPQPGRSMLDILLDPRSIQWLLAFGGALVVVGLIIYLWAVGVFANPPVAAVVLGLGNAALLGGGWAVLRFTRYQTAGRALTLLACLLMPLNLWFYHAHQLLTLEGHLWVAALVCCVLYAASALVLRDPLFVYVFVGGMAMTGLLILADQDVHRFWEIAGPSALLVVLGLAALHAERAFPPGEGPFSRQGFGMAFFWSAQALLAAGLLLLLGAQIFGWLHPALKALGALPAGALLQDAPAIVTEAPLQVLALLLVLAGTYAYLYSDIVVRHRGVYLYLGVFTLLWSEVLAINLLGLEVVQEAVILALALTALAANLLQAVVTRRAETLARTGAPLGLFLNTIPVLLGVVLHLRATNADLASSWPYTPTWGYVGAMLATALSCRVGAYLYRHRMPRLSATYFFGTAAATLVSAAGLLLLIGVRDWSAQAVLLMLAPIAYLTAARLYRGHTAEEPLVRVAHTATAVMVAAVMASTLHITSHVFDLISEADKNPLLAVFFAEATVFYGLATAWRRQGWNVYLAATMACAALWQVLLYWGTSPEYYTLAFALVGLVLLILYRLAVLENFHQPGLAQPAFQAANALLSLAFLAAALLTASRLLASNAALGQFTHGDWKSALRLLMFLLGALTVLSLLAAWLVQDQGWRRWYRIMAIALGMLGFLVIHRITALTPWQQLEIFSVALGMVLLLVGHWGRYREQERLNDGVSLCLFLGSVLAGLPLAIAVLVHRCAQEFSVLNELGLFVVSVVLLATGVMFHLRSTTLLGALLAAVYLLSLAFFVSIPERLQTAGLGIALGGVVIFVLGLLLSMYRDRLATLPDKIKRREGIFRVLNWR